MSIFKKLLRDKKVSINLALLAALGVALLFAFSYATQEPPTPILEPLPAQEEHVEETTLLFVGDIMLSRSVGAKMQIEQDWTWPFLSISDFIQSADIAFANLETTISNRGQNVGSIYSFRADPRSVEGLVLAGFDIMNVANNHMGDWTRVAMEDTFTHLRNNGIEITGGGFSEQEAHSATVIEKNGVRFGFLGYTDLGAPYTQASGDVSGIAWLDKQQMIADIERAKQTNDAIIVTVHMGEEYQTTANARQVDIARAAIDAGATLFIGHHPHVVQNTQNYNDGYIAYSLGNFIFDQTFSRETMTGLAVRATFEGARLVQVEEIPVDISRQYQASIRE